MESATLETALLSFAIGIGLAAACGFRIFIPMVVMSLASRAGYLSLGDDFEWIASTPALVIFGLATIFEIGAYYVPFLDNLLDTLATPSAVIAGILATASQVTEVHPLLGWSVAIVAGGGAAGLVQGLTTFGRQVSSLATAGFGNPILSTAEAGASVLFTLLAVFVAPLGAILVVLLLFVALKKIFFRSPDTGPPTPSAAV